MQKTILHHLHKLHLILYNKDLNIKNEWKQQNIFHMNTCSQGVGLHSFDTLQLHLSSFFENLLNGELMSREGKEHFNENHYRENNSK
jgi:hypothetical protein